MQLFNLYRPTVKALPLIANIPHSGLFVPEDIAAQFITEHLKSRNRTVIGISINFIIFCPI